MENEYPEWLLPEVGKEVQEERSAAMREAAQRVRNETNQAKRYLGKRDSRSIGQLIDKLIDHGPQTEMTLAFDTQNIEDAGMVFADLWALWRIKKLWRSTQGIHPGSGEESFVYGIVGVHHKLSLIHI